MDNLKRIIKSYEKWVAANPETVCDVETTTKWLSYFIAGRISDSNVLSELIYTLSNMLVLYNDRIIDKSRNNNSLSDIKSIEQSKKKQKFIYRLKVMLTTLEYSEVFIEISAKRVFGTKGKWLFVTLVQFAKAAGRLIILKQSTESIITTPALPTLNRSALIKKQKAGIKNGEIQNGFVENGVTFQLKRSGRLMRKVEGAPPVQYRDFKLLNETEEMRVTTPPVNYALLRAEYLYIAKPLIHLASMGIFGNKRWKQYIIALTLDLTSIRIYHQHREHMNKEQKLELSRRTMNLLLYLMRSPFYEGVTRSRLDRVLSYVASNIPLIKMVAGPIRDYLPYWQDTYFYLWST